MSLNNCTNCPPNCFGNDLPADCVVYNGESLKSYLDDLTPSGGETPIQPSTQITSDDVLSKSSIIDTSSVCASNIINRTVNYSLSTNTATSTFNWDLLELSNNLPEGYSVAVSRVRIFGSSLVNDSSALSGSANISINLYPVTVTFSVRVISPCGDIDLEKTIKLLTPSNTGSFKATLDAKDLNPQSGDVILTVQLNNLESRVNSLSQAADSSFITPADVSELNARIDDVETKIDNPDTLEVNYVKDGGTRVDELSNIINDLYLEIQSLKTQNSNQQIELDNLRDQIDSINA